MQIKHVTAPPHPRQRYDRQISFELYLLDAPFPVRERTIYYSRPSRSSDEADEADWVAGRIILADSHEIIPFPPLPYEPDYKHAKELWDLFEHKGEIPDSETLRLMCEIKELERQADEVLGNTP